MKNETYSKMVLRYAKGVGISALSSTEIEQILWQFTSFPAGAFEHIEIQVDAFFQGDPKCTTKQSLKDLIKYAEMINSRCM
jgi:hypothetical protein